VKEEIKRIIKLVEEGKLSSEDAAELIEAFSGSSGASEPESPDEAGASSASSTTEEPHKDFFSSITEAIEKIGKDAGANVNWKDISEQARTSAHKGFEALKNVGEQISKGKWEFNLLSSHESRSIELPLALEKGKTLRIDNPCGDVKITGGFDKGRVVARAKVRGSSVEDAREKANGYTLVVEESEQLVLIKQPDMSGLSVDVEIEIPGKRAVEVWAASGDIEILDTNGAVRVNNRSGQITVRQADGAVDISAMSGDVALSDAKSPMVTIESKSGSIELKRVEGNINARTASGQVKISQSSGKTVSVEAVSGDVEIDLDQPVTGSLNVRTVSGGSLVSIVDGSDARVSLSTLRGEVTAAVPLEDESKADQRVTGRIGEGKGTIDISAVTGSVRLEMHNSAS
jgi:DUF4097 and DUF4098 domain-containing protein YvlB